MEIVSLIFASAALVTSLLALQIAWAALKRRREMERWHRPISDDE